MSKPDIKTKLKLIAPEYSNKKIDEITTIIHEILLLTNKLKEYNGKYSFEELLIDYIKKEK